MRQISVPDDFFLPDIEVPANEVLGLEDYDVNEDVNGMMSYEVVEKNTEGVAVRINSMMINRKKRIT